MRTEFCGKGRLFWRPFLVRLTRLILIKITKLELFTTIFMSTSLERSKQTFVTIGLLDKTKRTISMIQKTSDT